MAVYTVLEESDIASFIGRYGVGTLAGYQGIGDGIENTNYFVSTDVSQLASETSTADQRQFVLTVFEELERSDVEFYLNWLQVLNDGGLPVAAALVDSHGSSLQTVEGKPAALFPRASGGHLDNVTVEQAFSAGAVMAKMHLIAAQHSAQHDSPKNFAWVEDSIAKLLPLIDDADAQLLTDSWQQAMATLPQYELPSGIIHTDLFRDNALFDGDDVSCILDFYSAGNGRFGYDLAVLVNDWASEQDGELNDDKHRAILAGYDSVKARSQDEIKAWPLLMQLAAIRFWVSRLTTIHLPSLDHRPGALTQTKNPEQYKAILLKRQQLA
ncbi:Homoserine kinase [Sinobacterium norvegicum]|uniref:Homoserine kinase n=1 Tax=Sinobacterium norvegicum TaxID=1641715 RepID=A0ABM9AIE2_9GAMM|nr:homoserine kinase [Sinobacterium norvegicum]CAH0992977.1 Homoserine kinase [Sinobacterium norvegicum]